jgi:hypothetical protein
VEKKEKGKKSFIAWEHCQNSEVVCSCGSGRTVVLLEDDATFKVMLRMVGGGHADCWPVSLSKALFSERENRVAICTKVTSGAGTSVKDGAFKLG